MATKAAKTKPSARAKKLKMPDLLYITHEGTPGTDDHYLSVNDKIPAFERDWKPFGVYQLVGSGKAREVVEDQVEMEK